MKKLIFKRVMNTIVNPPVCNKISHFHRYNKYIQEDQFHWLKDTAPEKSGPIVDYLKEENAYSKIHLDKYSQLKAKVYQETLAKIKEDDDSPPVYRAPYHYYSRSVKGLQYSIYCRKLGDGPEEVLLDTNKMEHEYCSLGAYEISPNHKILAYALDLDGSELYTICESYFTLDLKNIADGTIIRTIEKTGSDIEWFNNNQSILYNTLDSTHRSFKIFKYFIDDGKSIEIFHERDEKFNVGIAKTLDDAYLLVESGSKMTSETHYIDANIGSDLKLVNKREHGLEYTVEHHCGNFLITTNIGDCINFKVIAVPVDTPSKDHWVDFVPYDSDTQILSTIPMSEGYIALYQCSSRGFKNIKILNVSDGTILESTILSFPEEIYLVDICGYSQQVYGSGVVRFSYSSMTTPPQVYEYDFKTSTKKCLKKVEFDRFNPNDYKVERIYAMNGSVSIPISLVYRKDMKKNNAMPLYLYGYGSYGISIDPNWSPKIFSLLDRGIIYAIAHIRGGGDCSRPWYSIFNIWYLSGKFLQKKNTFDDFVACAKHLVKENYTDHSMMAIEGRSAGGLLMGAVLNIFPGIAHVAVVGVPFVDGLFKLNIVINTMMDPSIPLTVAEYEEW
jgi:oligopeptidase B